MSVNRRNGEFLEKGVSLCHFLESVPFPTVKGKKKLGRDLLGFSFRVCFFLGSPR